MSSELETKIKDILFEARIPADFVGKRESLPDETVANVVAYKILLAAGLSEHIAQTAVKGFAPSEIKCDGEIQGYSDGWNFCTMYDGFILKHAIKLAHNATGKSEVGMKYPHFPFEWLVTKYSLVYKGDKEPLWSIDRPKEKKVFYEVWQNDKGVIFSFEKGRAGTGGYAGAIFPSHEESYQFAKWYLSQSHTKFYIKDMDLYINGLGGLDIEDFEITKKVEA